MRHFAARPESFPCAVRPDVADYARRIGSVRPETQCELTRILDRVPPDFVQGLHMLVDEALARPAAFLGRFTTFEEGGARRVRDLARATRARLTSDEEFRLARMIRGLVEHRARTAGTAARSDEDPQWPTPSQLYEVELLLKRLTPSGRLLCAITAVEMVLPRQNDSDFLQRAVAFAWNVLRQKPDTVPTMPLGVHGLYATTIIARELISCAGLTRNGGNNVMAAFFTVQDCAARHHDSSRPQRSVVRFEFVREWWARCRHRLAVDYPEATEVSGRLMRGDPMRGDNYKSMADQLRTPRPRVLTWNAQREMLCPHDPADDPEWELLDQNHIPSLVYRLPHASKVICGLVAVEMALPVWDELAPFDDPEVRALPHRVAAACRQALRGPLSANQRMMLNDFPTLIRATYGEMGRDEEGLPVDADSPLWDHNDENVLRAASVLFALSGVVNALPLSAGAEKALATSEISNAVDGAASAVVGFTRGLRTAHQQFFKEWWARCRCRLAIADPDRAVVSGSRALPFPAVLGQRIRHLNRGLRLFGSPRRGGDTTQQPPVAEEG